MDYAQHGDTTPKAELLQANVSTANKTNKPMQCVPLVGYRLADSIPLVGVNALEAVLSWKSSGTATAAANTNIKSSTANSAEITPVGTTGIYSNTIPTAAAAVTAEMKEGMMVRLRITATYTKLFTFKLSWVAMSSVG
jgi:hypothetical protein